MKPLKLDVVGCGAVTQQYHIPVIRSLQKNARLLVRGCFDLNINSAKQAARTLSAKDFGLLNDQTNFDGVDCALIATPPDSHVNLANIYLRSRKHVLIEKPIAISLSELNELITLGNANNVRVLSGHFRRFYPSVNISRLFILSGGLGRIHKVEVTEGNRWSWPASSSYAVKSRAGGVILDTGSHLLDMLIFVLGLDEPQNCRSFSLKSLIKKPKQEPSHHCSAIFVLNTEKHGEISVRIEISRLQPLACGLKIYGEHGILLIPTSFANKPLLCVGNKYFRLNGAITHPEPNGAMGCFMMEYEELLNAAQEVGYKSTLEATNFTLLTSILECLVNS